MYCMDPSKYPEKTTSHYAELYPGDRVHTCKAGMAKLLELEEYVVK